MNAMYAFVLGEALFRGTRSPDRNPQMDHGLAERDILMFIIPLQTIPMSKSRSRQKPKYTND